MELDTTWRSDPSTRSLSAVGPGLVSDAADRSVGARLDVAEWRVGRHSHLRVGAASTCGSEGASTAPSFVTGCVEGKADRIDQVSGDSLAGSYVRRLLLYCIVAVIGSSMGSLWTWTTNEWSDANPLTAGLQPALLSLGPAIGIVSAAQLRHSTVAAVAGSLFVAMVAMWWLFASSDSSTSALVFLWGWFLGIPVAGGIVIADRRPFRNSAPEEGVR